MVRPTLNQESSCNANNHSTPGLFPRASYVGLPSKGKLTLEGTCSQVSPLANSLIHHRLKLSPLTPVLGCQLRHFYGPGQTGRGKAKEQKRGAGKEGVET